MKTEEFDIDIEQEARGHRVNRQVVVLFSITGASSPFHWWSFVSYILYII